MRSRLTILILLTLLTSNMILNHSCRFRSGSNCFGASTPVDLTLQNTIDRKLKVTLLEFSDEKGFKIIDRLTLNPKQNSTICLEYEGAVSNGLYIYSNETLSKLKLSTSNVNSFDLNNLQFKIEMTDDIKRLIE